MSNPTAETPTRAPAATSILEANLEAIARRSPRAARAIATAEPSPDIVFVETQEGPVAGEFAGRALCSRRRPLEEAARLSASVDLEKAGAVVVLGFALGHHVAALAARAREVAAIIVFEPDIGLLRAVLERIDHSGWISSVNIAFVTEAGNAATLSASIHGLEGALAVGIEFLEHPPSRARLGSDSGQFAETFTRVFRAVRTHIITTMVQTDVTVRNELMNIDHYARWPGIADLASVAAGRAAIVVSAGPSLKRNIDLLKTPGLRDRCVIICVQTVLRQLLAEGIRPHFVTAIDYHEISKRFYEGITADQVADVTLIAEARANPAILDAFPGPIRVPQDEFLTRLLSWEDTPDRGAMIPAATVAHLAYYLARHLGADPVILIGQDLAFTDGQYYARGAAIHDTWAPELNPFNTLEMMEWQRIVRARGTLHEARDHLGRPVYTDEQMATYLAQFERDFQADTERGLSIIDATEGGVAKAHAEIMTLAKAIERFAPPNHEAMAAIDVARAREHGDATREVRERLGAVRTDVRTIARRSREARDLVRAMERTQRDVARTNRLIDEVNAIRDKVQSLSPAFALVMRLNQMGALKRFKADRSIKLADALDPFERQRRQIERDAMNLQWVGEYADLLDGYLGAADAAFDGAPKLTRDTLPQGAGGEGTEAGAAHDVRPTLRTAAILLMDATDLDAAARPFLGRPVVGWTLARLARCRRLDTIGIVTDEPARVRELLGAAAPELRVEIIEGVSRDRARSKSIAAGRAWADASWRGGLAGLTAFDEAFDPVATHAALTRMHADAAVILTPTWGLIDPHLTDELIERHLESPEGNALAFTQAPPGLAPAVLGRELVEDLAQGQRDGLVFASIGGAVGYLPTRPRHDPIARPSCVQIDPALRGTLARFILDDAQTTQELQDALGSAGPDLEAMPGKDIAARWRAFAASVPGRLPREILLELTTTRPARGNRFWFGPLNAPRAPITIERARHVIEEIARTTPDARLTLAGLGDPLEHEACIELIHAAKSAGLPFVHMRTDLLCAHDTLDRLMAAPADVISVDLCAHQAHTYAAIAGVDRYRDALENLDELLRHRTAAGGMPSPWIVPRITRRDAVYEEIEAFFDKWILLTGTAVIDQLPEERFAERIEPLGKPRSVLERDARRRMTILCDGAVIADEFDLGATAPVACAFERGIADAWSALAEVRLRRLAEGDLSHPDLRTGW